MWSTDHRTGFVEVRFVPVSAASTEYFIAELIDRYQDALTQGQHHPVLLVGLFVLDLLTIHPFADGNGRVVRALTNALLDDAGYTVGRYVSLEQLIAESADGYYAALLASTHGWHEQTNDPWPWLAYFTEVLARAYQRFDSRAASDRSTGTKQDRVREYVLEHAPQIFRSPTWGSLPGISDLTIRLTLEQLKNEGRVKPEGRGNRKGTNPGPPDRTGRTRRTAIVLRTPPPVLNSTAANCGPPFGTKRPQVQILSPRPVPQVSDLRECRALRAASHLPASRQRPRGNKKEHEGTPGKAGADFDGQKNTRPPSTT